MPTRLDDRFEQRSPLGRPFAESLLLHAAVIGALGLAMWIHSRAHGNEWGQNLNGAIQANLVSSAPAIPLPQIQKPTDNVLATENPSPAPAIDQQKTEPAPDLNAIPLATRQPKKEPPPKKQAPPQQEQKHAQQPPQKDRVHFGEQQPSSLARSMAQQQKGPASPVTVAGGSGFRFPYYVAIINRKFSENWLLQEVDSSTAPGAKASLTFTISRDGAPSDIQLEKSSGSPSLDQSCLHAVQRIDSFGPLPAAYNGSYLRVGYDCTYPGR
jgi:protein TonB